MDVVTERCYDCPGPSTPAIATKDGWMPITAEVAHDLALSGMLLAFSPEHVDRLRNGSQSSKVGSTRGTVISP